MSGMKRILFVALVAGLVGLAFPAARAHAAGGGGGANKKPFVPQQCIVVPAPGATIDGINAFYQSTTVAQVGNTYLVQLPATANTSSVVREMRASSFVAAAGTNTFVASPNTKRKLGRHQIETFPNDLAEDKTFNRTGYDTQEFLDYLNVNEMTGPRGTGSIVAVIDTGADLTHPDLVDRFLRDSSGHVIGMDFVDGDDDPSEVRLPGSEDVDNAAYGHGTFIAGLIAKIAPDARIMPIRALGSDGVGKEFDIVRAVDFALAHGAQVVNMSFGAAEKLDGLDEALGRARDHAVLIASAGNDGTDRERQYPAEESYVNSVAAVTENGIKTSFSNYGSLVDFAAPGDHIVSTYPGGGYATWSGTSFSAPMVAATAALVVSRQGGGTVDVDCVEDTLQNTSRSLDYKPENDRFRGKIGRLVDPAAAFDSPGCQGGGISGKIDLVPTDRNDRKSEGEAERKADGSRQEFEVRLEGLPNGQYTLRVTTTSGTVVTDGISVSRNQARLEYSSESGGDGRPLPDGLSPVNVIRLVEIVRPNGTVILSGDFADGTGGGGGGGGGGDDGGGDDGGGGGDDGGGDDGGGGGDDGGGGSQQTEERIALSPVGSDADASGNAEWRVDGARQRFKVECEDVNAGVYQIRVDGVVIGTITIGGSGQGEVEYDTNDGSSLPPSIDPVSEIGTVEILDGSGQVILSGAF